MKRPTFAAVVFTAICVTGSASAQQLELRFEQDRSRGKIPVGPTPRSILVDTLYSYHRWVEGGYNAYRPDSAALVRLEKAITGDLELLIFYGTWCSDTRRELPRFLHIADRLRIPDERMRLYALNRAKQRGDSFARDHGIERVPTIIFFREGKELGRIVESPRRRLESDMLEILTGTKEGTP